MAQLDEELLTVAQAAARLGVSEPRLRRLLARPEHAPRVVTLTRRTQTGTRTGKAVPLAFLAELQTCFERVSGPDYARERERERSREREREAFPRPQDALATRLLAEQAARIEDLRAQVAHLQGMLDAANDRQAGLMAAVARVLPPAPEDAKPKRRRWWIFGPREGSTKR